MKRFSRSLALGAVVLAAMAASLPGGQAQGADRGTLGSGQGRARTEHCLASLELSAKQKAAVEAIRSSHEASQSADVEAWRASQRKLREDTARGADKRVLEQDVRDRDASAAKVRGSSQGFRAQILASLTPEQQTRFNECDRSRREAAKHPNPPAAKAP